jgi:hypothetical protein
MVVIITAIGLTFASVTIVASVHTQTGDTRNQADNSALAAADAAINLALLRQNQVQPSSSAPCLIESSGKLVPGTAKTSGSESGWCQSVGPNTVGLASSTYQVKPCYTGSSCASGSTPKITVVATGCFPAPSSGSCPTASTSNVTVHRLAVTAASSGTGSPTVFGAEGVVGVDWIKMAGSASIYGDAGSNGYIDWTGGNPSMPGCTQMRGEFRKLEWQQTPCPAVRETHEYPNVVVPTENSNSRMFTAGGDTYTWSNGALGGCGASAASWCATTKVLRLTNDATVTLGGSAPYVFCQLILQDNTQLIMAANSHIRIIFDSPENCGLASGSNQMQLENSGRIVSQSFSPGSGNYSVPGFYFVGSSTRTTKVVMNGAAAGNNMIIYGPRTEIQVTNGASFGGAILGKTVYLDGGIRVKPEGTGSFDPDENLPIGSTGSADFARSSYVECGPAGSTPSTGC